MSGVMPSLFLSHGAPSLVLEDCPAREFLRGLGKKLPKPSAIVVMSAHFEAERPIIGSAENPETIYDFRGFPDALYQMKYPARGKPELAARMKKILAEAGIESTLDPNRGLDHGIWNPLMLIYPDASIPIVPLSINPSETSQHHAKIGGALAGLREEGVLFVGSGSITHNLSQFFGGKYQLDSPDEPVAREFADWISDQVSKGNTETLLDTPDNWPAGRDNHPTDDHILPFYFALGSAGSSLDGRRLHKSTNYGVLAMDAYEFGAP